MTGLKTLKDFGQDIEGVAKIEWKNKKEIKKVTSIQLKVYTDYELRQEAIRWVKWMIKQHPLGETGNCYLFAKFFNLTEEDLK